MKKILKEPLLYFLLLGGAIFFLFQQVANDASPDDAEIVVTTGQIKALQSGFEKVWQRPPGATELEGLIQSHIREEVLYREALGLGLDKQDGFVRRRMSQKMQFLLVDLADLEKADENMLQTYLNEHIDQYTDPARFTFRQIYFSTSKRGPAAQSEAEALLVSLDAGEVDGEAAGDPIMISHKFERVREADIERILGAQFSQALSVLPVGSWQGPIESGFGLHLVFIDELLASSAPELADVRDKVLRDWSVETRMRTNQKIYEKLQQRYNVVVEDYAENAVAVAPTTSSPLSAASE